MALTSQNLDSNKLQRRNEMHISALKATARYMCEAKGNRNHMFRTNSDDHQLDITLAHVVTSPCASGVYQNCSQEH